MYPAIVTANTRGQSDSKYHIKLRFPWLPAQEEDESHWARVATPMAGPQQGAYFLPEVGDQVFVLFEHGDIGRPIVIGSVWSQKQPPPETNSNGKNNLRVLKSKSGHRLIFDDSQDSERVILVDSTKKNKVVLDSANKTVTIETADGDIEIKAPSGAARLHGKSVNLTTTSALTGKGLKLQIATRGPLNCKGDSALALKGPIVQLNPDGFGGTSSSSNSGNGGQSSAASDPKDQSPGDGIAADPSAAVGNSGAGNDPLAPNSNRTATENIEPDASEFDEDLHWIEIQLVDENRGPITGQSCRITLPDGTTRDGTTDAEGILRIDDVPQVGDCQLYFVTEKTQAQS